MNVRCLTAVRLFVKEQTLFPTDTFLIENKDLIEQLKSEQHM